MIEGLDLFIRYSMVVGSFVGGALFGMLAIVFLMALVAIALMACAGLTVVTCDLAREWWANRRGEVKP